MDTPDKKRPTIYSLLPAEHLPTFINNSIVLTLLSLALGIAFVLILHGFLSQNLVYWILTAK